MAFIVFLVIKTYQVNNELVTEDYYSQELQYQDRINKMKNVTPEQDFTIFQNQNEIVIHFPPLAGKAIGSIEFFRPADKSKDLKIPFTPDKNGNQLFMKKLFSKGLYKIKADWSSNGISYYSEKEIYIK